MVQFFGLVFSISLKIFTPSTPLYSRLSTLFYPYSLLLLPYSRLSTLHLNIYNIYCKNITLKNNIRVLTFLICLICYYII